VFGQLVFPFRKGAHQAKEEAPTGDGASSRSFGGNSDGEGNPSLKRHSMST
jgi:hypothetical protein